MLPPVERLPLGSLIRHGDACAVMVVLAGLLTPLVAGADQPEPVPAVAPLPVPAALGGDEGDARAIDPVTWPASTAGSPPASVTTIETHSLMARDLSFHGSLLAPLVAGSLSLVSAAAGGSLLLDTKLHFGSLQAQCHAECAAGDITPMEQRTYAGYGLVAIGAAGVVVSLVELVLTLRPRTSPSVSRAAPRVLLLPTVAGLVASGRF